MQQFLVSIAQLNYISENTQYNLSKILNAYKEAKSNSVELLIFSSFATSGYLEKLPVPINGFFIKCNKVLVELAQHTKNSKTSIIIGSATEKNNELFCSIFLLQNGNITLLAESNLKSNKKYNFIFNKKKVELHVLNNDLAIAQEENNPQDVLLFIDNRSYIKKRKFFTEELNQHYNACNNRTFVYVNQVGGNSRHVFSGGSFVMHGKNIALLGHWQEESKLIDIGKINQHYPPVNIDDTANIYQALMLGLSDYVTKNNFSSIILGLSGGIDSTLVATIACDALGSAKVRSFMLQSEYTSKESIEDAGEFADRAGMQHAALSISSMFSLAQENLRHVFASDNHDITEENIQARIRGMILMAISNKFGSMLLATGNKSEMSVGYATIYGDMCGGFAPIKDIYKTEVYKLCRWRNNNLPQNSLLHKINVIPKNIINKPPSAELRYNQTDQDTLPDYNILDPILIMLIEENKTVEYIVEQGYDVEVVNYIIKLIKQSEYKRLQSPLGPHLRCAQKNSV